MEGHKVCQREVNELYALPGWPPARDVECLWRNTTMSITSAGAPMSLHGEAQVDNDAHHQFPALSRNQQFHGIATSALRVLSSNRAWQLQSSGIGLDEDVLGIPTSCPSQLAPCRKLPGNPFVCFFVFWSRSWTDKFPFSNICDI